MSEKLALTATPHKHTEIPSHGNHELPPAASFGAEQAAVVGEVVDAEIVSETENAQFAQAANSGNVIRAEVVEPGQADAGAIPYDAHQRAAAPTTHKRIERPSDRFDTEINRLLNLGMSRLGERMASKDPNERARAFRTLTRLSTIASKPVVEQPAATETEPSADEAFKHSTLSPDEMQNTLQAVHAEKVAEPTEATAEQSEATAGTNAEVAFVPGERAIAELAIKAGLEAATIAKNAGKLITPETLLQAGRNQMKTMLLESNTLDGIAGSFAERVAIVDSVYDKLPQMMRQAFEAQEAAARAARQIIEAQEAAARAAAQAASAKANTDDYDLAA